MAHSRKVGELENQLLQLGAPVVKKELPEGSEEFGSRRQDDRNFGNGPDEDSFNSLQAS